MAYRSVSIIDLQNGKPGMLIPVFITEKSNLPYVQEMDEFMRVFDMVPFFDYDRYSVIPSSKDFTVQTGDGGLIAFRSYDGEIIQGDIPIIFKYIEENRIFIKNCPTLDIQIQRIEAANLSSSYLAWEAVALSAFKNPEVRKFWLSAEYHTFKKLKSIWESIDTTPEPIDYGPFTTVEIISEFSTEYLIRWLSDSTNFHLDRWIQIWRNVLSRTPFDIRMIEIGTEWLYYMHAEQEEISKIKEVLYIVLEYWSNEIHMDSSIAEYVSDLFDPNIYLILEFITPKEFLLYIFDCLTFSENFKLSLQIIEFLAQHISIDAEYAIITNLALNNIMANSESMSNIDFRKAESLIENFSLNKKINEFIDR